MTDWKTPRSEGFPTPPFASSQQTKGQMVGQVIGGLISIWLFIAVSFFVVAQILDADVSWQESGLVSIIYVLFRTWDKVTFGKFPK